jgi:hypothetical protein
VSDEKPKRRLRVLTPSMSNAGALIACQWPYGRMISSQPLDHVVAPSGPVLDQAVWSPPREVSVAGTLARVLREKPAFGGAHRPDEPALVTQNAPSPGR